MLPHFKFAWKFYSNLLHKGILGENFPVRRGLRNEILNGNFGVSGKLVLFMLGFDDWISIEYTKT